VRGRDASEATVAQCGRDTHAVPPECLALPRHLCLSPSAQCNSTMFIATLHADWLVSLPQSCCCCYTAQAVCTVCMALHQLLDMLLLDQQGQLCVAPQRPPVCSCMAYACGLNACPCCPATPVFAPSHPPGTSQDSPLFYARLFGLLTPQTSIALISLILVATRLPADLTRTQPVVTYTRLASMETEVVGRLTGARLVQA
jgi:hypothetical protein